MRVLVVEDNKKTAAFISKALKSEGFAVNVLADGDEVDRLIEAFNTMAARLDQSFQQVREFTLRASHELKTPLSVMRGELETALR